MTRDNKDEFKIRDYYNNQKSLGIDDVTIFKNVRSLGWTVERMKAELPELFESPEKIAEFNRRMRPYLMISLVTAIAIMIGMAISLLSYFDAVY